MIQLSIIILSYNTKDLTIKCLESITSQYKKQLESGEFEVIIVDNNSADETVKAISNRQSAISKKNAIKVIVNKENFGFSKANNIGAEKAEGRYLFFLNSDTEVQGKGLLEMVSFLDENPNVGTLGARLKNIDGTDQKSAGKFYTIFNVLLMLTGFERLGFLRFSPKKVTKVDWVTGAAMMVRSKEFKEIGGFDGNIFMYTEDMELCFRIRKQGLQVVFYPDIKILHSERGSSNKTFAIVNIYKGLLYFYKKHKSYWQFTLVKLLLIIKAIFAILIGNLTGKINLSKTYQESLKNI